MWFTTETQRHGGRAKCENSRLVSREATPSAAIQLNSPRSSQCGIVRLSKLIEEVCDGINSVLLRILDEEEFAIIPMDGNTYRSGQLLIEVCARTETEWILPKIILVLKP